MDTNDSRDGELMIPRTCISRMTEVQSLYVGLPSRSSGPSTATIAFASRPSAGRRPASA